MYNEEKQLWIISLDKFCWRIQRHAWIREVSNIPAEACLGTDGDVSNPIKSICSQKTVAGGYQHERLFSVLVEKSIWERTFQQTLNCKWPDSRLLLFQRHKSYISLISTIWKANLKAVSEVMHNKWTCVLFTLFLNFLSLFNLFLLPPIFILDLLLLLKSSSCFNPSTLLPWAFLTSPALFLPSSGLLGITAGNSPGSWSSIPPLCRL